MRRRLIVLACAALLACAGCVHSRTNCGTSTVGLPGLVDLAPKAR